MNINDVPVFLAARVPALASAINGSIREIWEDYGTDAPLSDHILGSVVAPIISRMLHSSTQEDRATLRKFFTALDELMVDENPNMRYAVLVSFVEQLDKNDWELAQEFLGENLRGDA